MVQDVVQDDLKTIENEIIHCSVMTGAMLEDLGYNSQTFLVGDRAIQGFLSKATKMDSFLKTISSIFL